VRFNKARERERDINTERAKDKKEKLGLEGELVVEFLIVSI